MSSDQPEIKIPKSNIEKPDLKAPELETKKVEKPTLEKEKAEKEEKDKEFPGRFRTATPLLITTDETAFEILSQLQDGRKDISLKAFIYSRQTATASLITYFTSRQLSSLIPPLRANKVDSSTLRNAAFYLAPKRVELFKTIRQDLAFSDKRTNRFLYNLEKNWPKKPNFNTEELQATIERSLTAGDIFYLKRQDISIDKVIEEIAPTIQSYYLANSAAQEGTDYVTVSNKSIRWAKSKKLKKHGLANPIVVDALLKGATPEWFQQEVERLEKEGKKPQALRIKNLAKEVEAVDIDQLPLRLRFQIKRARVKAKLLGTLDKTNPFSLKFYHYHFPKGTERLTKRIEALKENLRFLTEETPAGLVLTPRKRFRRWRLKQRTKFNLFRKRLQTRNIKGWWHLTGKITKNKKVRKFLYHLPRKLKPRYWLRPAHWLKKRISKLLIKAGAKFGKEALVTAGKKLAIHGFKQLATKGAAFLLGAATGAATAGVGTVITVAVTLAQAGFSFVKKLFTQKGREDLRRKFTGFFKLGSGALIGLKALIAQFPLTFAFATAGAFLGPVGIAVFGVIGFGLDKVTGWFTSAKEAVSAAVTGKGATTATAMAAAPEAGAVAGIAAETTTAAVGVGGAVTFGVGGALITTTMLAANFASRDAFGPPEGMIPWESEYIRVEKVADKKALTNEELDESQTITYTVTITPKQGELVNVLIKDEVLLDSNQEPKPAVPQLKLVEPATLPTNISSTLILTYQITNIDQRYQDSRITNLFTIEAKVSDTGDSTTATAIETIEIGTPPVPDTAELAQKIVTALLNCNGLERSKTNGVIVDKSNWPIAKQCLIDAGITDPLVLSPLENNFTKFEKMQCVQMAVASSRSSLEAKSAAKLYCQPPTSGYQLIKDWSQLQPGDFIVAEKVYAGHIAVVVAKDDHIIRVAEALGFDVIIKPDGRIEYPEYGSVQFRTIGLNIIEQKYCGFLRKK